MCLACHSAESIRPHHPAAARSMRRSALTTARLLLRAARMDRDAAECLGYAADYKGAAGRFRAMYRNS